MITAYVTAMSPAGLPPGSVLLSLTGAHFLLAALATVAAIGGGLVLQRAVAPCSRERPWSRIRARGVAPSREAA
jgi:hypothetical protein